MKSWKQHPIIVLFTLFSVLFFISCSPPAFAQEEVAQEAPESTGLFGKWPQPAMQNVFLNVIWGSAIGGIMGLTVESMQEEPETRKNYWAESFFTGATYGAIFGLIVGVTMSYTGITFDKKKARIALTPVPPDLHPNQIVGEKPVYYSKLNDSSGFPVYATYQYFF